MDKNFNFQYCEENFTVHKCAGIDVHVFHFSCGDIFIAPICEKVQGTYLTYFFLFGKLEKVRGDIIKKILGSLRF